MGGEPGGAGTAAQAVHCAAGGADRVGERQALATGLYRVGERQALAAGLYPVYTLRLTLGLFSLISTRF